MSNDGRIADPRLVNPVTCAFLGDSIYELLVREEILCRHQSLPPGKLHNLAVKMVCATAQAQALHDIEPLLTEQELTAYRRGRNVSSVTPPKHTDVAIYRTATGFEALLGDLHLRGRDDRIRELFSEILRASDERASDQTGEEHHEEYKPASR